MEEDNGAPFLHLLSSILYPRFPPHPILPPSRKGQRMTQQRLRWGILGTGNIARQFAAGVAAARRSVIAAVASRSAESAQAFARQFGIAAAYGLYDDLLTNPAVDAVYVSLPNTLHHPWTLRALRAGKHVL